AVEHMIAKGFDGVDFVCIDTDVRTFKPGGGKTILQLDDIMAKGLGAGADPRVGRQAALGSRERLTEMLEGADLVFIVSGMGAGTGTGGVPVIAELAKGLGILTVAVVTTPFSFEGKARAAIASHGIDQLRNKVDSLIVIPTDKLINPT